MKTTDPRFEIRPTPYTGDGLFAIEPVKDGDFILEYTGRKITTAEADEHPGRYLFELDEDWTIDGDTDENLAKYINHACDPNTEAEVMDGHILFGAIKDIAVDEELTVDYGEEYFDEFIKPVGCKCNSKTHRK